MRVASVIVLAACGSEAAAPPDAAPVREPVDILWIAAHPDDELYLAPALGAFCVEQGKRCALLVFTHGERGNCKRPELCSDGLEQIRKAELATSAAMLHATVEQWDLGDGLASSVTGVAEAWAVRAGGEDAFIAAVRDAIVAYAPAQVFSFDPRHGSSCHPDHRATGAIAALALPPATPMFMVEAVLDPAGTQTSIGFVPAAADDPAITRFDQGWSYLVQVLTAHASQFTDAEIAAIANASPATQATYTLAITDVVDPDPRYAGLCD